MKNRKYVLFGLVVSVLITVLCINSKAVHAAVDSCTWTGASDDSITNSANWTGCDNTHTPQTGDTLVFPQSASHKAIVIDGINFSPRFIQITGTGYSLNRSGGNNDALTLDGASIGLTSTEDASMNIPIVFGGTTTNAFNWAAAGKNVTFTFGTTLDLSGRMEVGSSGKPGVFRFNNTIVGSAGSVVTTNGATLMVHDNSFSASLVGAESGATYQCLSEDCFGNASNHIYMGGGLVQIDTASTYTNDIETSSPTSNDSGLILGSNVNLSGNIAVHDGLTLALADSNTISGDIAIDDGSVLRVIGSSPDISYADFSGVISGDGGITYENCFVNVSNTNTYTGETTVSGLGEGTVLDATNTASLGSENGGTTVEAGGSLEINNGSTPWSFLEPLTLEGEGNNSNGGYYTAALINNNNYTGYFGTITLAGDTTIANNGPQLLVFAGRITGTGDLTFTGTNGNGIGLATSSSNNDFSGKTTVDHTRLFLNGNVNRIQIPHDLTVIGGSEEGLVQVDAQEQINNSAHITLTKGAEMGRLTISSGITETVGMISGDGEIRLNQGSLRVGASGASGEFDGHLFGSTGSTLMKFGTGSWKFNGYNDLTSGAGYADIEVAEGKFIANAADVSLELSHFSVDGGTLGGINIVGPVNASSGSIAPGNSPGCLYPAGNVSISSATSFDVQLNGSTVCNQYDQLSLSGTLTLTNPTLNISLGYTPSAGTVFTIARAASLTGTFANIPNNTIMNINGVKMRVNYNSTDITLTVLSSDTSAPVNTISAILAGTGQDRKVFTLVGILMVIPGVLNAVHVARKRKSKQ